MIKKNSVKCLKCGTIIESKTVHDYVTCVCGNIAIDGGHDYQRLVGHGVTDQTYQDLSIEGDLNYGTGDLECSE